MWKNVDTRFSQLNVSNNRPFQLISWRGMVTWSRRKSSFWWTVVDMHGKWKIASALTVASLENPRITSSFAGAGLHSSNLISFRLRIFWSFQLTIAANFPAPTALWWTFALGEPSNHIQAVNAAFVGLPTFWCTCWMTVLLKYWTWMVVYAVLSELTLHSY